MNRSNFSLAGLVVTVAAFLTLFAAPAAQAKPTITISGSTSVAPLATLLAQKYVKSCKGRACPKFKILQGGSDVGISDAARGRVTIGMSSRDPKPGDPGGIVFNRIAKDAMCIVTNRANSIRNFDRPLVQSIFGGRVRRWDQVPGSNQNGTIDIFVRTAASGTQDAFEKIFMLPERTFSGASQKASNGLVQQSVKGSPGAIGYVSYAFADGLNSATYKGVPCTLRNAKSGQYGGVRGLYFVTRGKAKGPVKKWVKWIRTNRAALKIASTEWVPFK